MEDKLMLPEEARAYLRLSKSKFNHLCATRTIPLIKRGHLNRFRKSHLDAWLEENTIWVKSPGRKRNLDLIREGDSDEEKS